MKKTIFKGLFIAIFIAMMMPVQSFSQEMKNWNWDSYKIKFQLPTDWVVKESSGTDFIAKGPDDVTIRIKPLTYIRDSKGAAKYGFDTYDVVLDRSIKSQSTLASGDSGLERYIIFGEGKSSATRSPIFCGVIGLKHPETGKTLYVRFWWFQRLNAKYSDLTYKIANSFKKK